MAELVKFFFVVCIIIRHSYDVNRSINQLIFGEHTHHDSDVYENRKKKTLNKIFKVSLMMRNKLVPVSLILMFFDGEYLSFKQKKR